MEDGSTVTAGNGERLPLAAGSAITRELAASEKNLFEIALDADQLLRLFVTKGDMAVSLTIYDPAGQKSFEQVSHRFEVLEFSIPASSAGTYLLEIRSLELNSPRRQYELKTEPVRSVATLDQKKSMAQRAAADATILRANWTQESLRQAIKKYSEAATIWLSLHELRSAAFATMQAGEICVVLGEYREALVHYQKARAQARSAGARLEEARALSETGRLYSYLGENDLAQKEVLDALKVLATNSETSQPPILKDYHAESLTHLGEITYSKGDFFKSSKQFEEALKLFDEIGDRAGQARAHLFIGLIAGGLGIPEKVVSELSQSLNLYRAVKDKRGEGLALTALGLSHSLSRHEEHAIKKHRKAIDIFHAIGDQQSEAVAVNGVGQAYQNLEDYSNALEYYQRALGLFQEKGNLDSASVAMFNVAKAYRLNKNLDQALIFYQKCLNLSRVLKKVRTEANALNDIAAIYAARGSREKAIQQYRRILKVYAAISDRRQQALAWNNLGDAYTRFGEKQRALSSYERALALSEAAADQGVLVSSLYGIARAQRDLGMLEQAQSTIERSIRIIEDVRSNVASPDFRISYFSGVRKHYDLIIDVLMQLDHQRPNHGYAVAAFLASENARARSLRDILTEVGGDIRQGVAPELLTRERELGALLRSQAQYQMELSIAGGNPEDAEEVAHQINQLRTKYQEMESEIRDDNPRLLSLTRPAPLSLEQIQAQLRDDDSMLLEYALGDDRSYLWAVTADSVRSFELPPRVTLEEAGRDVYKLLTARQEIGERTAGDYQANVDAADRAYYEKAQNLSRLLLGQVAEQLGTKRLIIVTEGMLQYIPIDALPGPTGVGPNGANATPKDLLIATHEIVTLPSISTLAAIRQEKHKIGSSGRIVAVLADPVFNRDDDRVQNRRPQSDVGSAVSGTPANSSPDPAGPAESGGLMRLVHASEEADGIVAASPRGTTFVARDFNASRETATTPFVREHQILHFATHGFFNSEHPELSGIVLTMVKPDGSKTNGFIPLGDIYKLNLSAQLVVLSGCETALGKDITGEGLVSLTRAFMYAGSRSVVTSLWKVDDRATAELMKSFYESMLQEGMTPAAALRSAKRKIATQERWAAPYFWAGFVIQGEYREPIEIQRESSTRIALALVVLLVLISVGVVLQRRGRVRLRAGQT